MGIAYIHQIFLWFYLGTHNWHEHAVDGAETDSHLNSGLTASGEGWEG